MNLPRDLAAEFYTSLMRKQQGSECGVDLQAMWSQ